MNLYYLLQSNMTRDSLAKALYCRTVATIVRRANSLKRLGSTLGTLSSDSNESVHNQADVASQHASTVGTSGSKSSKSMAALNNAVRHATDGFIGILDMFGFEDPKVPHQNVNQKLLYGNVTDGFILLDSRVSWNTFASTCARRRCSTFTTRTYSSPASSLAEMKEFVVTSKLIMWITCLASTSYPLWYGFNSMIDSSYV